MGARGCGRLAAGRHVPRRWGRHYPAGEPDAGAERWDGGEYNQKSASHHVYAEIKGVWAGDRSRADGRYFVLGNVGTEFIVTNGRGIYQTGQQIIVERLTTEVGQAATTQIQTIAFNDEPAIDKLQQLAASFPNAALYLSGSLTIAFPEEVAIALTSNQYQTASLAGTTLTLDCQGVEGAIALLADQYASGTVLVKVIQPQPVF